MKIAIISDVHDNIPNLKKVLDYCASNSIEKIICCGDLASLDTMDFLNDNFKGEVLYAFGNMDNDYLRNTKLLQKYENTKVYSDFGEADFDNKKIAFVHKPEPAEELCRSGKYKFVFYGHTHKPFEEMINGCRMLNPGTVAGQFYPATFAVWNTENDKFKLVRIDQLK